MSLDPPSFLAGESGITFPHRQWINEAYKTLDSANTKLAAITFVGDYNPTGDGTTDDSTELQAAIDAAAGKTLVFDPSKTYKIDTGLNVTSSVVIDLNGATVLAASGIEAFYVTASDVTIQNGFITGSDAGAYSSGSDGIHIEGTVNGASVAPTRISYIQIINVTLANFGDYSIRAWYAAEILVRDCLILSGGYMGIHGYSVNAMQVINCEVDSIAGETSTNELNAYGIHYSNSNDSDTVRYPACNDCVTIGNTVKSIPTWHAFSAKSIQTSVWLHNTAIDCRRAFVLSFSNTSPKNNTIAYNSSHNGLAREATGATPAANKQAEAFWDIGISSSDQAENNRFICNTIYQHGAGIGSAGACFLQNTKNGVVKGNTFIEPYLTAITIAGSVDNYVIDGNLIIDVKGPGTGASPAMSSNVMRGIQFRDSNMDNITVSNNTFILRDSSLETYVMDIGILVANVSTKSAHFSGNQFIGMASTNFSFSGDVSGLDGPDIIPQFVDSDATPSVKDGRAFRTNTTTVTITDFDDGEAGQEIVVISKGAITYDTTATNLVGSSVDIVTASGDVTLWICEDGTTWRLKGFVDVSVDNTAGA